MKIYRCRPFFAILFLFQIIPSISAFSQDIPDASPSWLAEKVYLQLDNRVYTSDQTIWFKAIVTNAAYHLPTLLSEVLYVELIDGNKNIVQRKLIKLEKGTGDGFFQLSPAYGNGVYQVRAYTEWNKNFGNSFIYKEYIIIAGEKKELSFDPIKKLTVIEGTAENERMLKVEVDPSLSDSLTGKAFQVVLEALGKKDTLLLKRNRNHQYLLDYIIPAQADVVTLQMEMDNSVTYTKTIIVDTGYIDLQFFPESGELVHGLPSIIALKAVNVDGHGRKTEGEILNEKGERLTFFSTNELGMGTVDLGIADSAAKYSARIFSDSGVARTYRLPNVSAKGNSLSIKKKEDKIIIRARSNYLLDDSITVRASCRGKIYFDFKGKLNDQAIEFSIDPGMLPEGIIDFTLLVLPSLTPVAERLYFNQRPGDRLNIAVHTTREEYKKREKTEVAITISNHEGEPVPASVSLLVLNQSHQQQALDRRQNILTFFLLSSELKGEVENPGYYFNTDANRSADLDALLLTQGWRKYNYSREPVTFRLQPETGLTLSGSVKGGMADNKVIKDAELTMMAFGKPPLFATAKTDSLGRFNFLIDDEYGDKLNVIIQSANKANKKRQYLITIDPKEPPPIDFNYNRSVRQPDDYIQGYIRQMLGHKKNEDAYRNAKEGVILQEVIVKTRILSSQQKEVTEKYGKPAIIIDGKDIQAKEEKWSYGLYSVLLFQFPDKVSVRRFGDGVLYARIHNAEPTLVVIDGIPVKSFEYSLIPNIPPSEVKSFELIPYAKNFMSLFCEAIACGPNTPAFGNVIAIYTYAGKGLYGVNATIGISKIVVPVFSQPREFYVPRYETLTPEDWQKPDLRSLVHWDPKIKTDATGSTSAFFYNSDYTGTIKVIVEAISENGEIGYSELFYAVKPI